MSNHTSEAEIREKHISSTLKKWKKWVTITSAAVNMTLFCPFNCVRACKHQIIWKSHPTTADFIHNEKAVNAAAVNEKVEKVKEVVGGGGDEENAGEREKWRRVGWR